MSKQTLIDALLARARHDLGKAREAAAAAEDAARDESMKSDGKYDTRGIEAGYLAGAQSRRVEELQLEIQMLEEIPRRDFRADEEVAVGALVDLELNGQVRSYFLATTAGGTVLTLAGRPVLVISVFSPIGDGVLGLTAGDEFELETASGVRHHRVVQVR